MVGDGNCSPVSLYGELDVVLLCDEDVRMALCHVAVVHGLVIDMVSFDMIQGGQEIVLNHAGALMLDEKKPSNWYDGGNFVQGTRVPSNILSPTPALVAAMMQPGPPKSMNVKDFFHSLEHANSKVLVATAKHLGIKLVGIQEHCAGRVKGKAIKRRVSTVISPSRRSSRATERLFMGMGGPYAQSAGLFTYVVAVVDDESNYARMGLLLAGQES